MVLEKRIFGIKKKKGSLDGTWIQRFPVVKKRMNWISVREGVSISMKKGKQKNNATTRAGRKEELTAYLCLIPAFLGVTLISYLPTLAVFVLSLFDWNGITKPEFIGLANFQRIFTKDIYFWDSIKATVWYTH